MVVSSDYVHNLGRIYTCCKFVCLFVLNEKYIYLLYQIFCLPSASVEFDRCGTCWTGIRTFFSPAYFKGDPVGYEVLGVAPGMASVYSWPTLRRFFHAGLCLRLLGS